MNPRAVLEPADGRGRPSQYYCVHTSWAQCLGLVVVWPFASPLALAVPRWFRLSMLLVRVRCWFWPSRLAVVSFVIVFGSHAVLVLVVPSGGGFVCLCFWFRSVAFGFCLGRVRWFRFIFSQYYNFFSRNHRLHFFGKKGKFSPRQIDPFFKKHKLVPLREI